MSGRLQRQPVRYDRRLRDRLTSNLSRHQLRTHELNGRRHAAVGVVVIDSDADLHGSDPTVFDRVSLIAGTPSATSPNITGKVDGTAGGAALLLTRRGSHLNAHANQWAFPGGRIDSGETPLEAALREIAEEVNLTLSTDDLIGRLDDYPTRSGFVMSPFVFWAGDGAEPEANPEEVASVHRIALSEITRPDSPRFVSIPESDRPVVQIPIGGDLIYAPTGAIIHQFRAVAVDGLSIRVDDYEQPFFAWK